MKIKIKVWEKKCTKCKRIKDVSEFYRQSSNMDGYKSVCKVCVSSHEYRKSMKLKQNDGA